MNHYLTVNKNYKEAALLFQIGIATLHSWVKRFLSSGHVLSKKPPGRVSKVSVEERPILRELILNNADSSLTVLSEKWLEAGGKSVSISAMGRTIKRLGLSYKKNV